MRTTYLFTATAALLVASIPAFADGDCQAWNTTTGPVKVCVPPGTDASGYFWTFSALDPSTGASRPGLVLCSMECQEKDGYAVSLYSRLALHGLRRYRWSGCANGRRSRGLELKMRISREPCPWCAEHYPIVSTRQRHHVQNPECARKARNARDLGHNRRARARKKKPKAHTAYPVIVPNPYAWMRRIALNFGYRALRDRHPEDFAQEIEIILLELNLPRSSPVQLDAGAVRNYVRRSLYRVCQEYGFTPQSGRPVDRHVDLMPLLNHSQCNWHAAWYQA